MVIEFRKHRETRSNACSRDMQILDYSENSWLFRLCIHLLGYRCQETEGLTLEAEMRLFCYLFTGNQF